VQFVISTTPRQQLAEVLIDQPLIEYVRVKREARPRWSWALIAQQLSEDTDGKVAVTGQALRTWFADDLKKAS